jgi:hypothetical protein
MALLIFQHLPHSLSRRFREMLTSFVSVSQRADISNNWIASLLNLTFATTEKAISLPTLKEYSQKY